MLSCVKHVLKFNVFASHSNMMWLGTTIVEPQNIGLYLKIPSPWGSHLVLHVSINCFSIPLFPISVRYTGFLQALYISWQNKVAWYQPSPSPLQLFQQFGTENNNKPVHGRSSNKSLWCVVLYYTLNHNVLREIWSLWHCLWCQITFIGFCYIQLANTQRFIRVLPWGVAVQGPLTQAHGSDMHTGCILLIFRHHRSSILQPTFIMIPRTYKHSSR